MRIVGTGGCSMCGFSGRRASFWTAFVRSTLGEGLKNCEGGRILGGSAMFEAVVRFSSLLCIAYFWNFWDFVAFVW